SRTIAPIYARAALGRAAARSRGAGAPNPSRRQRAERAAPAAGLSLPHAVPAEDRPRVRGDGAAVAARERDALDRVPHPDRRAGARRGGEWTMTSVVFSRNEYARRLAAVRAAMRQRDAEIVLVDEAEHLAYLTGFDRSATRYQTCAIPMDGEPVMFLRAPDEPSFVERSWLTDRVTIADWEDPVGVIARELGRRGWANRRIGLELDSNYLTVRRWQSLTAAFPAASFVDFGEVLRELRLRKSPEEIELLRRAAGIADRAMAAAIAAAGEGRNERDAAAAASRTFLELGADSPRVGVITSGSRASSLHGGLGSHRLDRGRPLPTEPLH